MKSNHEGTPGQLIIVTDGGEMRVGARRGGCRSENVRVLMRESKWRKFELLYGRHTHILARARPGRELQRQECAPSRVCAMTGGLEHEEMPRSPDLETACQQSSSAALEVRAPPMDPECASRAGHGREGQIRQVNSMWCRSVMKHVMIDLRARTVVSSQTSSHPCRVRGEMNSIAPVARPAETRPQVSTAHHGCVRLALQPSCRAAASDILLAPEVFWETRRTQIAR